MCLARHDIDQIDQKQWFAIRVTYCRELVVKAHLDQRGIASYVPMHSVEQLCRGKKRAVLVPLIHNLLFVWTSAESLRELKATTTLPICYIMDRATKRPAVIPEAQMRDFMAVTAEKGELVEAALDLSSGDLVRVINGPFKGITGFFIRHKGRTKVAVSIRDIATALTAHVSAKDVEKLINEQPINA